MLLESPFLNIGHTVATLKQSMNLPLLIERLKTWLVKTSLIHWGP